MWALGVTVYALVFNKLPYWAESELDVLDAIKDFKFEVPPNRTIDEGLKYIIDKMLTKDPATRISLEELKKCSWVNDGFHYALDSEEVKTGTLSHYKVEEN